MQNHRDIPRAPSLAEVLVDRKDQPDLYKSFSGNQQYFDTDYIYANLLESPFPEAATVKNLILANYIFNGDTKCGRQLAALVKNKSITMLVIRECYFDNQTAFDFAEELAKGEHTLVCLDFDGCTGISDVGLNALMDATKNQVQFKQLTTGMCQTVTSEGFAAMDSYNKSKGEVNPLSLLAASVIANNPGLYAQSQQDHALPADARELVAINRRWKEATSNVIMPTPQQTNQERHPVAQHNTTEIQVEDSEKTQTVSSSSSSFFNAVKNGIVVAAAVVGLAAVVSKGKTPGS